MAGSEKKNVEIISDYYKKMLSPSDRNFNIKRYPPTKMTLPFTGEEISKITKGIKNGKAAGSDNLQPELIKYAPIEIHNAMAEIYNEMAETGNYPEEINLGILAPIQKAGKAKGHKENLRPLMLLSIYITKNTDNKPNK